MAEPMHNLSHRQVEEMVEELAAEVTASFGHRSQPCRVFGIPRGGIPVSYLLCRYGNFRLVDSPEVADVFIDDIVDSGNTREQWGAKYPGRPFLALVDRQDPDCPIPDGWVVFPWENNDESSIGPNIVRLLQYIGENPAREGLTETPNRVAKAWKHWTKGYHESPEEVLKVFEDGAENYDEMVLVRDIPFYSHCEHHLAPFFGTATVAYVPNGKIVGLSKVNRLVDMFARRLQVQERLTSQIADALADHLKPKGVGVILRARHLCMESRGVCQQGHHTITSALRGVLATKPEARAEFMALTK